MNDCCYDPIILKFLKIEGLCLKASIKMGKIKALILAKG